MTRGAAFVVGDVRGNAGTAAPLPKAVSRIARQLAASRDVAIELLQIADLMDMNSLPAPTSSVLRTWAERLEAKP